jgi:hypothetical protein
MSGFAFMRAAFLIALFPRIISRDRKWYQSQSQTKRSRETARGQTESKSPSRLATNPEELYLPIGSFAEEEPVRATEVDGEEGTTFDLLLLRISLIVDRVLTMCAAFATKSWHIYLGKCPRGRDGDQTNVLELLVCFYSPQAPHLLPREYSAS